MSYEIETVDGLRRLRSVREDFLIHRRLPADFPAWLGAAWRRAGFLGLDVERDDVPTATTANESDLVRTAAPVLQSVAESLTGLRAAVVLSDERARIIGAWASEPTSRIHLDGIGTRAGADLSEGAVGSNGISHVLLTRRPAVIGGPQHLLGLYQQTVCAGAPVHGPRRSRPVGAVAVVGRMDAPSPVLQALAATAAASVERELLHTAGGQERRLLEAFLRVDRDGAPVVVLDGRTRFVSDAAAALLDSDEFEVLEAHALAAAREGHVTSPLVTIGRVDVHLEVATSGDSPGIVATLHRRPEPAPARSHRPTESGPFARAGLVGSSPLWRSLERAALRAAGRPLLLTGEPGVGKSAIAGAVLGQSAVAVRADDDPGFLNTLARQLGGDTPVVIRRLDVLTSAQLTRAAELLAGAAGPVAATWRLSEPVPPELRSSWSSHELLVSSLRERGEDIAQIAGELAPTARFTVAARTLLRRYSWPGNMSELQAVLRCALAAAGTAAVGPEHLPADLRAAAARPRLTELEKAERSAIVEALRSTDGNRSQAAVLLGIGRATLYRKIHRYRLD